MPQVTAADAAETRAAVCSRAARGDLPFREEESMTKKTKVAVPGKTPSNAEGPRDPKTKPELEPGKTPGTAEGPR